MARTIPIQTSFAGGEISPKLHGRVDSELWRKGLDECINFEPLAHGPLLSRGGTRWMASYPTLTSKCRLVEFPRQGDIGFLLLFGAGALRVLDGTSGAAVPSTGADFILNPRFTYGWQYWTRYWSGGYDDLSEVGFFSGGRTFLHQAAIQSPGIRQATASLPAGTYSFRLRYSTAPGATLRIRIGSTLGGTEFADQIAPSTAGLSSYGEVAISVVVAAPGAVYLDVSIDSSGYEMVGTFPAGAELQELSIRNPAVTSAVWDGTSTPTMPWTDDQLEAVQIVSEPAKDRVMFFHPEVAPHEMLFDAVTGAWTFQAITFVLGTNPPWTTTFPSVAELYQGRLILAGIPGKLGTILGSKRGEPYDFTLGTNASDAFSLDVSTKGAIRWLQGHRTLLIGTDIGEYVLTAQGGILTPSDFEVRPQSGYGSASIQSLQVMDQAMYVGRDRRRLRMLSFNLQENGWQTRDLTFTSEHLTDGGIQDIDWLSTGNDQVYAVLRTGSVVAWTFNRGEQVIAPWQLDFGGAVYALCVLEAGDQDKVWMLVQRAGTVCLEEWLVADDPERCLLDSYAAARPSGGVAGGLTWLAGKTVVAIVDGVATAPQVVTAAGEITVPVAATTCVVGIFSERKVTTLPKEGGQAGGTAQGAKQRTVKVSLRLNDSVLPLVNNVRCNPERSPETSMGEVQPRITADVTARVLGWDDKGAVVITQDVPLRTEILAIFGVLATNEV